MIDRACISLTGKCQLKCTYCHFDKHIDKSSCSELSPENLEIILRNILTYSKTNALDVFKIGLVGAGEPLLRFDLIRKSVEFAKEHDSSQILKFYTITNGIALNENIIKWFYDNKEIIKLCFSLDGNEAIHNLCRIFVNGKGTFSIIDKNINLYKEKFGNVPSINTTVHKKTIENAEEILSFFSSIFSEVCFSRLVDENDPELHISKSDFNDFMKKAACTKLSLRQLRTPKKYDCTMYGQMCGVGRTNIFYANGKVYPCGRFIGLPDYEIGAESDSLEKINESMQRFVPVKDGLCYFDEYIKGGNQ